MKKKILFMVISMNIGGVEKALLNMLKTMDSSQNEVTVLMLEKKGGFLNSLPDWVKVDELLYYKDIKEEFNKPPKDLILGYLKSGKIFRAIYLFIISLFCKLKGDRELLLKALFSKYPDYIREYDKAIAYAGPMALIDYYIANKVKAKKKLGWIHFDITTVGVDRNLLRKLYKKFDEINIVSKDAKEKFDSVFPEFKNKTKVFYNVILKEEILKLAGEKGFDDNYTGLRLLTVGRISKEKGQDLAIEALKKILDRGIDAKLYLVGTGNFEKECKKLAINLGIEDRVVFLGAKSNPYPYMKECDIYIQPSRYEGYCITLAEALIFDKKIVATKFTGALEQLKGKENSQICDYTSESISEGILKLLV
ncbi:MAG: glycosyltransferase [Candidatus Fusobacterium pullicola]|uniref:Glycosyltransferase n=1 Tax=Candidatus Fusobacterium pullicola TaxID=2838601 RepID=A0A9E2KXL5_9FUSO|nr:glycosyltransferase [Candidatus Fusobacterium pullicola]